MDGKRILLVDVDPKVTSPKCWVAFSGLCEAIRSIPMPTGLVESKQKLPQIRIFMQICANIYKFYIDFCVYF